MDYVQQRDGGGRFTGELVPDAELTVAITEDNRRAGLAIEVMDRLGMPQGLHEVLKSASGEHRWLGFTSTTALRGAMLGLIYGLNHGDEDTARMLADVIDALSMKDDICKLLDEKRSA